MELTLSFSNITSKFVTFSKFITVDFKHYFMQNSMVCSQTTSIPNFTCLAPVIHFCHQTGGEERERESCDCYVIAFDFIKNN